MLPTRTVKRTGTDTSADAPASAGDPKFPPGLPPPTVMPVDSPGVEGTGAPGAQAPEVSPPGDVNPEVRVRIHGT